ncbi:MAG: hypothetical protein KC546_17385 [Anaerolineae bacterium]|nr:hypothetical protein [Anaerolineae bacterium]
MVRIFILLLMAVAIASCDTGGTQPTTDDPTPTAESLAVAPQAAAVEAYLTAKVANDEDGIRRYLCSAMESNLDREVQSFSGVEASIDGMACSLDEGGETVTCAGTIVAVYGGENRDFPLGTYSIVEEDGEYKWCGEAG